MDVKLIMMMMMVMMLMAEIYAIDFCQFASIKATV